MAWRWRGSGSQKRHFQRGCVISAEEFLRTIQYESNADVSASIHAFMEDTLASQLKEYPALYQLLTLSALLMGGNHALLI